MLIRIAPKVLSMGATEMTAVGGLESMAGNTGRGLGGVERDSEGL